MTLRNVLLTLMLVALTGGLSPVGDVLYAAESASSDGTGRIAPQMHRTPYTPLTPRRDEPAEVVFSETFEEEPDDWTTTDLTNAVTAFHKSNFLARQQGDLLWWCGDTIEGYNQPYIGYDNYWLQYLDTPVLDLSQAGENLVFTFDAYWLLEDPRRLPPGDPYNGWDGFTVLISTDGGNNFSIISPESPGYTATRISAMERFWMLQGEWRGWVYHSGDWGAADEQNPQPQWVQCRFNLANFRRNNVVMRFMLATDRTVSSVYSGAGEGNFYLRNGGVLVDNLLLSDGNTTFLRNSADNNPVPAELIPRRAPGFGNRWQRTEAQAHGGEFSMWNDDDGFNLINTLDSPPFEVPQGFNTHFQFWVWADLPDAVHQGSANLSDFYQIYTSVDGGATWTYQTHDYNRADAGGQDWAHYVPGVPFAGNVELSLTDLAGQEVQLRWMFRTDNDHREGNGRGLFLDDIEVIASNQLPRDIAMRDLIVAYPLTVRYRIAGNSAWMDNVGTRDQSGIYSWWGWFDNQDSRRYPTTTPYPSIAVGESLRVNLTDFVDRRNPGWTPLLPGLFTVWAASNLGANTPADDTDDDQNRANDSVAVSGVRVWPAGIYELGYDARLVRYAYNFDRGTGPMTRFTPSVPGLDQFHLAALHFRFARNQNVTTQFRLHIYGAGDATTPGQEIYTRMIDVPVDSCYPGNLTLSLSNVEAVRTLSGDFWVWCEILRDDRWPQIIGDDQRTGAGRFFNFNGNQTTAYDADLMMHALVIPAANTAPRIGESTSLVDFGESVPGVPVARRFSIYSTGLNPLVVRSVRSTNEAFEVDWPGERTLVTTNQVSFNIYFTPQDLELYSGNLVIESNAEAAPEVSLIGSGSLAAPGEDRSLPSGFALVGPFPNPFNSRTQFNLTLDRAGRVELALYDLTGRRAATLLDQVLAAGRYEISLAGHDLPAGLYFAELKSAGRTALRKVALVR